MTHLDVFVTVDCDRDDATSFGPSASVPEWTGLQMVGSMHQAFTSRGMRYTIFSRCDQAIREVCGDLLWAHRRVLDELGARESRDYELGLHPHLSVEPTSARPTRDAAACQELRETHEELSAAGERFAAFRMGNAWHTNATMRLLDSLGYLVDSTALPGRRRNDSARSFDWVGTPNHPYRPSRDDYRRPTPSPLLNVVEVPLTTVPIKAPYDTEPLRRYVNLTYHEPVFRDALATFMKAVAEGSSAVLVLIVHTGEVVQRAPAGLLAYDWSVFERNLDALLATLDASVESYSFRTMSEAAVE